MNTLETQRLLLRRPMLNDLEDLKSLYADPKVGLALDDGRKTSSESLRDMLKTQTKEFLQDGVGLLCVINPERGQVIGQCGIRRQTIEGESRLVIQTAIDGSSRLQGMATEATKAVYAYAKKELSDETLIAWIDEQDTGSMKLAAKLGLTRNNEVESRGRTLAMYM